MLNVVGVKRNDKLNVNINPEDKFKEDKAKYVGEQNYNIDNENKVIKYVTQVGTIGHNYSRKTDIEQYLVSEGFSKK